MCAICRHVTPSGVGIVAALVVASVVAHAQTYQADPRATPPEPPATLDELAMRFLPLYEPLVPEARAELAYDDEAFLRVEVTSGVCYAFAAVGPGHEDLDVWVHLDGEYAGQDVRPDHYPIVEWCAPRDGVIEMRVHAFQGEGPTEYGVFVDPESARRASGDQDELSNRLVRSAARTAPRWLPVGPQWRRRVSRPQVYEYDVTFEAGRCYVLLAVGDAGVRDVDLMLLDGDAIVAQDLALDATPAVARCAEADETLLARVVVVRGAGFVAAQLLSQPP